jgi:NAD(P)H dehydrogenase (quinone)
MLVGLFAAARAGSFAAVDPTLQRLLGRRPVPMREVMAGAHAAATA